MKSSIIVRCLLVTFSFGVALAVEKSHNLLLVKLDKPEQNKDWIDDCHFELKKVDKSLKVLNMNFTAKRKIEGPDILCEMKVFQKTGGKYMKSPWDYPEKSCCAFMEQYETGWECLLKSSSFPKRCPFLKGPHWIKNLNVDDCNYPPLLPPNLPEDYKIEVNMNQKGIRLLKLTLYAKLKRRMPIF